MTSWNVTQLFLFVFLIMINPSKEDCFDHFNVETWAGHLNKTFPLVKTKDFKDTMGCTLEKKCKLEHENGISCDLLQDCFYRDGHFQNMTKAGNCKGETQNISFYNFMCLMAKAINHTVKGCDLDTVCNMYPTPAYTVLPPTIATTAATTATTTAAEVTTVLPPTTTVMPPTTVSPPTTTVLPPTTTTKTTTTTTTTILPPTTTATIASLAPTESTLAPTSTVKESVNCNAIQSTETGTLTLKLLLMSVICNMLLPLVVYLYMCHQSRRDRNQWVREDASLASVTVETTCLMTPPECHSVLRHSTVVNGNSAAAEEGTQL